MTFHYIDNAVEVGETLQKIPQTDFFILGPDSSSMVKDFEGELLSSETFWKGFPNNMLACLENKKSAIIIKDVNSFCEKEVNQNKGKIFYVAQNSWIYFAPRARSLLKSLRGVGILSFEDLIKKL